MKESSESKAVVTCGCTYRGKASERDGAVKNGRSCSGVATVDAKVEVKAVVDADGEGMKRDEAGDGNDMDEREDASEAEAGKVATPFPCKPIEAVITDV
jgi:hypothetical protein